MEHIISKAIKALYPTAKFNIVGFGYEGVEWLDEAITKPTKEQIDAQIAKFEVIAIRALSYPPIGDQLDALFHAGIFPEEMAAKLQAVKDKYPKEEV